MARIRISQGLTLIMVSVLLLVAAVQGQEKPQPLQKVTVEIRFRGLNAGEEKQQERAARVTAIWFESKTVAPVLFSITAGKPATADLTPGRWTFRAEAPGFWNDTRQVEVRAGMANVVLDLWPEGFVEGGMTLQEGAEAPKTLDVFLRPAPEIPSLQAPAPTKVLCPVKERTWRCRVPAGLLDLRFQADGFIPRYQWGLRISSGETLRLGRLDLRQGSSVLGWVVTADGTPLGEKASVRLRPNTSGVVRNADERARLESLSFSAPVNRRGFFQIDGVAPGSYIVEALRERFAPASATVRVVPGAVTEIANPPLVLDHPKKLAVFLDPVSDPSGEPWTVKLQRLDRDGSTMTTIATEAASASGDWEKAGLSMGKYLLGVGRSAGEIWWSEVIEVEENPAPIQVQLDVVRVEGTVRLGDEPLAAELRFGGKYGAVRIAARTNEKGEFETFLPKSGNWVVHVSSEAPPVQREIPRVKVEPVPGTQTAHVDLRLPDTQLRGRVVDEKGARIPRALVTVKSIDKNPEAALQARADEDGSFELLGVAPGPIVIEADAGEERASDPVTYELSEERDPNLLLLVVREKLRIQGTVVSSAGVVSGARIKAAPAGIRYTSVGTATSDAQGRFELSLPTQAREMLLAVSAPGFAFRMLRLPVPEDRKLVLGVEQTAGTLVVESAEAFDPQDPAAPSVYILRSGAREGLGYLRAWAWENGVTSDDLNRAVIPLVEPGEYRACLVQAAERAGLDFGMISPDRCASGFLAAQGELTLKVPGL